MSNISNLIPWRSRAKLNELRNQGVDVSNAAHIPKYNQVVQDQYQIHHVHGPNTWMADYLFFKPNGDVVQHNYRLQDTEWMRSSKRRRMIVLLAFVHCNSRLFIAYIVKARKESDYMKAFKAIFDTHAVTPTDGGLSEPNLKDPHFIIDTLITDYEPVFGKDVLTDEDGKLYIKQDNTRRSLNMAKFYLERGIRHIGINMNRTSQHSKLAPMDRMARTLRDMIFNVRSTNPEFKLNATTLKALCRMYNTSNHSTLSKYLVVERCTPQQVYYNRDVQNELCRRIMSDNYRTAQHIYDEDIKIDDTAWIHQPKEFGKKRRNTVKDDPYVIIEYKGPCAFTVKNKNKPHAPVETITRKDLVRR